MKNSIQHIFFILLLLLSGCAKSDIMRGSESGKRVDVQFTLRLTAPLSLGDKELSSNGLNNISRGFKVSVGSPTPPLTRSTTTPAALYNLWVFQFDGSGNIVGAPTKATNNTEAVNELVTIDVPLTVGTNQTIYFVSLGKMIDKNLSHIRTITELRNTEIPYLEAQGGGYVSKITGVDDIPYGGKVSGIKVVSINNGNQGLIEYDTPQGFNGGIPMESLVSSVTLKYKFELTNVNTLLGVRIYNVSSSIRVDNSEAAINTKYLELPVNASVSDSDKDADGFYTAQWYVAQNMQGTVGGVLTEKQRFRYDNGTIVEGEAPKSATYMEVISHTNDDISKITTHQIYIGKNNTNNFDIDPKYSYLLRTTVNYIDDSDGRIRTFVAPDVSVECATQNFDCHYATQPININLSGHEIHIGIYSDSDCKIVADPNDPKYNWLKISSSPNYTEAINSSIKPTNYLEAKVFVPTKLRFYLYCDEYVLTPDGEIPNLGFSKTPLRTLYVKIESRVNGNTNKFVEVKKVTRSQVPIYYVGRYGGDFVDGAYTMELGTDREDERKSPLDPDLPTGRENTYPLGYYNLSLNDSDYGTDNYINGRKATRILAENPSNLLVNTLGTLSTTHSFDNPIKKNGIIDLYQYGTQNTYAARFCYDLNRDEDGDGVISDKELKWYLPAINQLIGYWISSENNNLVDNVWSSVRYSEKRGTFISLSSGTINCASDINNYAYNVRCVREFNLPKR